MASRRRAATFVVVCVIGVAGCSAAPDPTGTAPQAIPSSTSDATSSPTAEAAPPSPSPSARERVGLAGELDIGSFSPQLTEQIFEYASDGESILYSSGAAGETPNVAPDLWSYTPGPSAEPELVWRNPERDRALIKLGGDHGFIAFVDMSASGQRSWRLWFIPGPGEEPILLDQHPGDADVSSLVPSFDIWRPMIAWTAFGRGPNGPVSQLLVAEPPDWKPRVVQERLASEAELWLPSIYGEQLVYSEIRHSQDRTSEELSVHLLVLGPSDDEPRRLDTSGRAFMGVITPDAVLWKEPDPGFSAFNWGHMFRYDLATGDVSPLSTWPQEQVNYPSAGARFVVWDGWDSFKLGVYDLDRDMARLIESYPIERQTDLLAPRIGGDLLVWTESDASDMDDIVSVLQWAFLPFHGEDKLDR